MNERARLVTAPGPGPCRLETLVREALPRLSRRLARELIDEGAVRVNGRRARKGTLVAPGDQVTIPALGNLAPEPALAVPVVYEDPHLAIVDKPGGMRAHAIDPRQRGSVAAFALGRFPETATVGQPLAPGLAHRLDTGTSGLLVIARSAGAWAVLRQAFREGLVEKRYLALVAGTPPATLRIDFPLSHDPADRRRMRAAAAGARAWPAVTDVTRIASRGAFTLVEATMRTGVTHQIRAHLAEAGHPVVGDLLYGGPSVSLPPGRHALHAASLRLPHPEDGRPVVVTSPWPADLRALAPAELGR